MSRNFRKLPISKASEATISIDYKNGREFKSPSGIIKYIDATISYNGEEYGMLSWSSKDGIKPNASVREPEKRKYEPAIAFRKSNKLGGALFHIINLIQEQILSDIKNGVLKDKNFRVKNGKITGDKKPSIPIQDSYEDENGDFVEMDDPIVRVPMKENRKSGSLRFKVYKLVKSKDGITDKEVNANYDNVHKLFTINTRLIMGSLKFTITKYSKGISIKPEFRDMYIHVSKISEKKSKEDLEKIGINMNDLGDIMDELDDDDAAAAAESGAVEEKENESENEEEEEEENIDNLLQAVHE